MSGSEDDEQGYKAKLLEVLTISVKKFRFNKLSSGQTLDHAAQIVAAVCLIFYFIFTKDAGYSLAGFFGILLFFLICVQMTSPKR